jgi:hypothetical protein
MRKNWTISQIEQAWTEYKSGWCFRYLSGGKFYISSGKPDGEDTPITKLERCRYKDCMDFPEYLKDYNG